MPYPMRPDKIRIDKNTQARGETTEEVVLEYAEAMKRGEEFPPILVYVDGQSGEVVLADGFHRYAAHMRIRPNDPIMAEQRFGDVEEALWAAIGANKDHGFQRTNEQKRNAARLAILHPRAREMSPRTIAAHLGVSHSFVNSVRSEMEQNGEIPWIETPMEKAQKALADPANEGKSNREIATQIGVAEQTIRRARTAPNVNGLHLTQSDVENHRAEDSSKKPTECCGDCINRHESGACYLDSVVRSEDTAACEYFEPIPDEKPEPEIPPPDYDNIHFIDPPEKNKVRRRNPNQYRKLKGTINLYLPPDNPQMFAVELRNNFEEEYLTACFAALRHLWDEEDE